MKNFFTRKGVRVVLGIFIVFLLLVLSRIPVVLKKEKSQETVAFIESLRLTMQDVDGSNLPPIPDPLKVDETLEGVDLNNNHIRDDVEHAIFEMYSDESQIELRSESLQYAMALGLYLNKVFDVYTWSAVATLESRAFLCLGSSLEKPDKTTGLESDWENYFNHQEELGNIVKNLVLNTENRKQKYLEIHKTYTTTTQGLGEVSYCDLSF